MADQQESDFAEAWRPDPGGTIKGVVTNIDVIDPNGNGPYPCVTVKTAEGERNIHAFHGVLQKELARRRPQVGDELEVTYLGKREGGAYGSYHNYRLVGGQARDVDWDAFLPEEERQRVAQRVPIEPSAPPPTGVTARTAESVNIPDHVPGADYPAGKDDDLPF